MARLIVKSPYIKCGGGQGAGGYMKYIATRERVEIIPDDRPPTRKQKQLITELANDFPDTKNLLEYEDYIGCPTKANASSLITLALEENWSQVQTSEGYAKYIATRPRAERLGDHGLFGDEDCVDLDKAMSELEHYTGVVKNSGTAAEYMHQAAQADNPWAQYLMGKLYLMGEGVEQDEDTAYEWFQAAAEQGHTYAQFFVDRMEQQGQLVSPSLLLSATRLLHHMGNIFRDSAPQDSTTRAPHIERKRLQKLRAKKIALGHKPDDYEEEQTMDGMTMGGW